MSNSVFKEYPSDTYDNDDEHLKIDANLVIVVNKNGDVSVDQRTLRNILVNKETSNASVSVVRVVSPTPSLQDEIDEDMKNSSLENEIFGSDTEEEEDGNNKEKTEVDESADTKMTRSKVLKKVDAAADDTPHVCLTVDHFYPPGEANKFANEVLGLAGILNPLSLEAVDYDYQRYVIKNDHCYTPLTSPSQQRAATRQAEVGSPTQEDETSPVVETPAAAQSPVTPQQPVPVKKTRSGRSVKKPVLGLLKKDTPKKEESEEETVEDDEDHDSTDELQNVLEDSDSEFSEYVTSSSEEDDDDSDADFNVNYRKNKRNRNGGAGTSANKKKAAKSKAASKISKQRQSSSASLSVSGIDTEMEGILKEIEGSSSPVKESPGGLKKKVTKNEPKKQVTPLAGISTKALKVTPLHQKVNKAKPVELVPKVVAVTPVHVPPKKEVKKPAPHVEAALFSDMTSLFSTPDIIKKVGDKNTSNPMKMTAHNSGFVQLNARNNRQLLPQHISVQPLHPRSSGMGAEQDKQLDLIDSIVKAELKLANTGSTTASVIGVSATTTAMMNENIPNIVKMLENQSNNMHMNPSMDHGVHGMNTTSNLLGDLSGTDADALPDDLLQHVAAELAANKDLQDIIDTQVLGVQNLHSTLSNTSLLSGPNSSLLSHTIPTTPTHQVMTAVTPKPTKMTAIDISNLPNANKLMKDIHRKDPIKIVRSDGRVITLPPIEAPATRASKRRAQNTSIGDSGASSNEQSPQVSSSQSKMALTANAKEKLDNIRMELMKAEEAKTVHSPLLKTPTGSVAVVPIDAISGGSRRNSTNKVLSNDDGRSGRRQSTATAALLAAYPDMDDIDSDESWNSEDDPDRLWCICKQPHNNRFMICCDVCEDWFHGKCVNITKAMGQQMEADGIEWTCPNCIKKKQMGQKGVHSAGGSVISPAFKTQTKVTDFMNATSPASTSTVTTKTFTQTSIPVGMGTSCIVCSAKARVSSIYCSDDCIRKHANNTQTSTNSGQQQPQTKLKPLIDSPNKLKKLSPPKFSLVKNKNDRVLVFEPNTGRCLAGQSAPTSENLKQWLKDHPTFEVVVPGSEQAKAIRNKQLQLKQLSKDMATKKLEPELFTQPAKIQTQLKVGESKNLIIVKASPQQQQQQQQQQRLVKSTPPPKPVAPPKPSPTPRQPRKQATGEGSSKNIFTSQAKSEPPIRESVKKTLEEQLLNRMQEMSDSTIPKMSAEEIAKFAHHTEKEMFLLFSRDTGTRYKAKYRSLMFNIKDPKNFTLFRKICDKSIRPYQLVRMTPDELASQELAKWRENENKHQLEMIKKSELDLLSCAKSYVLKTHKGEEVMEGRETDMIDIDKNISVEDVVTALNNSAVSSTSEMGSSAAHQQSAAEREIAYVKTYQTSTTSNLSTGGSSSKKKKVESHRSRSRESDHHSRHKTSRKRSRERSRERDERKRSHDRRKDEKHNSSREKEKKHHHREKSAEKVVRTSTGGHHQSGGETPRKVVDEKQPATKIIKLAAKPKQEDYNLIDKILESSSTLPKMTEDEKDVTTPVPPVAVYKPMSGSLFVESDQEPTSTVMIPTPPHKAFEADDENSATPQISPTISDGDDETNSQQPILWSGNIKMFEVATFPISAQCVSGDTDNINVDLPAAMDIVGRISPETVWEYITKIRKSPNKEILILRLSSIENMSYFTLYSYLDSRKRLGVVKTTSQVIKDFYIMPLPSHKMLPSVLLPVRGPGFVEGADKPDLLLGIIVKAKLSTKRSADTLTSSSGLSKPNRKSTVSSKPSNSGSFTPPRKSSDGYTPPSSPKVEKKSAKRTRSKLTLGLPTVTATKFIPSTVTESETQEDMDEPYSPGGSDDGCDLSALPSIIAKPSQQSTNILTTSISTTSMTIKPLQAGEPDDELQRKMEEINRQIEASKMEIAGIAGILTKTNEGSSSNVDGSYSNQTSIPALDRIAIPSNLSEILASIKNQPQTNQPTTPAPQSETITIDDDDSDDVEEYVPTASFDAVDSISTYRPSSTGGGTFFQKTTYQAGLLPAASIDLDDAETPATGTSRLAQLTDEELLSMVPDDVLMSEPGKQQQGEAADNVNDIPVPPVAKKTRFDEPPPPGMDG